MGGSCIQKVCIATKLKDAGHLIGQYLCSTSKEVIYAWAAKPIIDIAIELLSFDEGNRCVPGLEKLGYSYKGTDVLPDRHYFNKGEPRTHQIHMYQSGSENLNKQLLLRDYLNINKEARKEYQQLKECLAKEYSTNKFAYAEAKTDFINKIIREAERAK